MRRSLLSLSFLLLFSLLPGVGMAQALSARQVEQLSMLGKVWGFLKYHHPAVSQGRVDWDSVLVQTLSTWNTQKSLKVDRVVEEWLDRLPGQEALAKPVQVDFSSDSITYRNYSLQWLERSKLLTKSQKKAMVSWAAPASVKGTYYSQSTPGNRYSGRNEKVYENMPATAAFRLLTLFRFWNVIEYYYPYKYLQDQPWEEVLTRFIPRFIAAEGKDPYLQTLQELTASLQDTHTSLSPTAYYRIFGEYGPPFACKMVKEGAVITRMVDASACEAAALQLGDVIQTVNGRPIQEIIAANQKYIPASNEWVKVRDAYWYLFNGTTPQMEIAGLHKDGRAFQVRVRRIKRRYENEWFRDGVPDNPLLNTSSTKPLSYVAWLEGNMAYIEFSMLEPKKIDSLFQALSSTAGLIFDLRGYNDDGNLVKTFYHLLPDSAQVGIKTIPNFQQPGTFYFQDYIISPQYKKVGRPNAAAYKGQVVVLIDESTQSAEELWAMMFKTVPGVVVIGTQTAGADGNITPVPLPDGYAITFSGLGIYYSNGAETQRIGIQPDIQVKPTLQDYQLGRDPLVERAVQVIKQKK